MSSRLPLPPNRTCGSPASGSPVGGFTSERIDGLVVGCEVGEQPTPSKEALEHLFRPQLRGPSTCIWLGQTVPAQAHWPRESPARLALRALTRGLHFRLPSPHASTFLSPFAPRPLRRFSAPMGTVTPRQVSCPTEVSPLHVTRRFETILPPNTQRPPSSLSHATPQLDGSPLTGSRLRLWLAGSPGSSGRIKFVSLRTGLSPPVALHPASRRRSYLRLPGRRAYAWRGLAPLYVCARGRTSLAL